MHFDAVSWTRVQKRRFLMLLDAITIALSLWFSLVLRLGDVWPAEKLLSGQWFFVILPFLGIVVFNWCGVYRNLLRSIGLDGFSEIARGVVVLSLVVAAAAFLSDANAIPASTPVIFGFVLFVTVSLLRVLGQSYYYWLKSRLIEKDPIVIYGAAATDVNAMLDGASSIPITMPRRMSSPATTTAIGPERWSRIAIT